MPQANWRDANGYAKLAPKQGKKLEYLKRGHSVYDDKAKANICLKCTKLSCKHGTCERLKKKIDVK